SQPRSCTARRRGSARFISSNVKLPPWYVVRRRPLRRPSASVRTGRPVRGLFRGQQKKVGTTGWGRTDLVISVYVLKIAGSGREINLLHRQGGRIGEPHGVPGALGGCT